MVETDFSSLQVISLCLVSEIKEIWEVTLIHNCTMTPLKSKYIIKSVALLFW